jgi:hypothetical protein
VLISYPETRLERREKGGEGWEEPIVPRWMKLAFGRNRGNFGLHANYRGLQIRYALEEEGKLQQVPLSMVQWELADG